MNRIKITNDKFSVSVCQVANSYGCKTIGSLRKFLKQCKPCTKLYLGTGHIRALSLLKEVDSFFNYYNNTVL